MVIKRCGGKNAARDFARRFVLLGLCIVGASPAAAQEAAAPAPEMPSSHHMHHHQMDGGDGAFHRSFDGAENWAKEFDAAERNAWQKPQ